ncbi:hypothetical protein RclHR1_03770010 [Rhizophagus clarus]|uniref:Uncharacterized protein n=1 Tax=Rhizophagus clarus TaxID=94130 RepID=A0A2Z6RGJ0_9GLOM|nr:hypothetical protein RclHR1_03770010 [Rhizophagus clarus]
MENFEKTWSTSITELIKTFEAELIKDLCHNLFQKEDYQFAGAKNASNSNNHCISASLGKKHLRLTLDRLYIRVKDMLQPSSQGNNFKDLEPQQSWAQLEQSAPIISTESQVMIINSKLSAEATSFISKLAVDLIITQDVSVITSPVVTLPATKPNKGKEKQGSIQKITCDNNMVHESQNRQRRTIMIYDVPTTWSPDKIRSAFSDWDRVLNIFFKTQYKYYTILQWFPDEWKLTQRKSQEIFQTSFRFSADTTEDAIYIKFTSDGESLLQYMRAAAWKVIKDKQGLKGILYFETHERLMRALTLQTDKIKLTNSRTPLPIKSKKTKDNKSDSTQKIRQ